MHSGATHWILACQLDRCSSIWEIEMTSFLPHTGYLFLFVSRETSQRKLCVEVKRHCVLCCGEVLKSLFTQCWVQEQGGDFFFLALVNIKHPSAVLINIKKYCTSVVTQQRFPKSKLHHDVELSTSSGGDCLTDIATNQSWTFPIAFGQHVSNQIYSVITALNKAVNEILKVWCCVLVSNQVLITLHHSQFWSLRME